MMLSTAMEDSRFEVRRADLNRLALGMDEFLVNT